MQNQYMNKYQIGQQVGFVYTNAVRKIVHSFGKIEKYEGRYYYIRVSSDMPLFRVYCNKVKANVMTEIIDKNQEKNQDGELEKKATLSFPNYYDHLEYISSTVGWLLFGLWVSIVVQFCMLYALGALLNRGL